MGSTQEFNQLYRDVSENMSTAMADLSNLRVDNKEGQERLASITNKLREIQSGFDEELEFLEVNSEWEKFTMAFFGETNAGKSTIIESLRILFNEQSRQKLIDENQGDLEKLSKQMHAHAFHVEKELNIVFKRHAEGIEDIRKGCSRLADILRNEATERVRVAEEEASSRVKRNLFITGSLASLAGAILTSSAFLVLGA